MAKGQYLSHYQQGIVRRYYDHADTLTLTKLAESVSDLAVVEGGPKGKAAVKIWTRVRAALAKAGVAPEEIESLAGAGDVSGLAALVGRLSAGAGKGGGKGALPRDSRSM